MRIKISTVLFTLELLTLATLAAAGDTGAKGNSRFTTRPVMVAPQVMEDDSAVPMQVTKNRLVITKTGAQSETTLAVDPTDPAHLLASSNDLSSFSSFNNVLESFDNGRTWALAGVNVGTFCYDPWVAFNSFGDAFFAYECSDQRVAYRLKGSNTWVHTTLVSASPTPDRDMITVDRNPSSPFFDSVYIGYDENSFNNAAHVLYSRDGFTGWVKSPKINDTSSTIGVNVAACPNGAVYAVWEDFSGRKIWVDRSLDGGTTWGTDHIVTNYRLNTTPFFISIPPQPDRGILPFPFATCAPEGAAFAGRLYVSYVDQAPSGSDTDIYVRYSDDGGLTWSAEREVDDESVAAYQFHNAIAVAEDGTVAVSFYDTRLDFPANQKTRRMISFSTDGGATWTVNQTLSSASSDESGPGDPNDYGDYQGMDARPGQGFWSVWTDSRPGTQGEDVVAGAARP